MKNSVKSSAFCRSELLLMTFSDLHRFISY